jgi:hypothetical protein
VKKLKKNRNKKIYAAMFIALTSIAGITYAAFADRGRVLGTKFTVGSSDIRLLEDLALGAEPENLKEELIGPSFEGISPNWQRDYNVKIYNNSPAPVQLTTNANYETANDPEDLRQIIFVEPFEWEDTNGDGLVDTGEKGASLGKKTIIKWKTEGFALGEVASGEIKAIILRLSTDAVADSKQGAGATFDFEFDSIGNE